MSTEFAAPVFQGITGADATEAGNVVVGFQTENGEPYRIEISKGIVGSTIAMIAAALKKTGLATLDDNRRESDRITSLRLTAFRPMITPDGEPGLAMVLQNHLEVPVVMKRDAIPALKTVLDQLENLTAPPSGAPEH